MSQATRILAGLGAGLALGIVLAGQSPDTALSGIAVAEPIGTAWLNALRMTIVPLVVALLITGVAQTAEAARAGRIATRSLLLFIVILWTSSALGALFTLTLLDLFPLGNTAAEALRATFGTAAPAAKVPPFTDFLVAIVPTNPVAAAANDQFLPLILFTLVFGFALTRLPQDNRGVLAQTEADAVWAYAALDFDAFESSRTHAQVANDRDWPGQVAPQVARAKLAAFD